ncbi:MAG: class SAM-dependent methyltransferase [Ferruginibacter sp.]|nr:class SAM-dependent methyltransferase [Ferruginibacter sp.]
MIKCNICGCPTTPIEVKEQMMGLNERFVYSQCVNCGHTHLNTVPQNMSKYYNAKEYYSFKDGSSVVRNIVGRSLTFIKKKLLQLNIKKSILYSSALKSLQLIDGIDKNDLILDYGCGAGQFVNELNTLGFKNARGFDPFLPEDKMYKGELCLTKNLDALKAPCWDIITLNHVFEHLENPIERLRSLNKLLCVRGKLLLRFPIIDSFAFEKYRENWVQFDAPRHLNLFTRKSIKMAVEKAGNFRILAMHDDSFHFQFTGSELYLKKLSLSPKDNSRIKRLLKFKTYQYHFLAKKLNKQNKGDQMVIILEQI